MADPDLLRLRTTFIFNFVHASGNLKDTLALQQVYYETYINDRDISCSGIFLSSFKDPQVIEVFGSAEP